MSWVIDMPTGPLPIDHRLANIRHGTKARHWNGQASDVAALRYVGQFELRRSTSNNWGIFLRGTSVRVGSVYKNSREFVRALSCVMDCAAVKRPRAVRKAAPSPAVPTPTLCGTPAPQA